jgi:hypothetical protein
MQTKQSYSKEEIKNKIIKDRLSLLFSQRPKAIAKILTHLIKRQKNV